MFGTYDLLAFRNLNGQLSRRSVDVHFPRYRAELGEERKIFINVVHSFQNKLPVPEPPDLVKCWEFLYERSLGCVGVLKQWLVRALSSTLRHSGATISLRALEAHALSPAQCDKILSEIIEGEARLNDGDGLRSKLRVRLGLAGGTVAPAPGGASQASPTSRQKLLPGQRKPVRDPIGQPVPSYAGCV